MKPDLQSKLESIFSYPFFRAVGKPLPLSVTKVNTWAKAVNVCTNARKWENCQLMARNALQRFVEQNQLQRRQDWNPLTDELRPQIASFVNQLLPKTTVPEENRKIVADDLSWDIMFICLEFEYRDVVEPFFSLPLLDPWYAEGHFPCGWDGEEFPDRWDGVTKSGKLIVF